MQIYDGAAHLQDYATAMAIDGNNNVYVTGASVADVCTGLDYATIKYLQDGTLEWVQRYNGANKTDIAKSIAVDANFNVYVSGGSLNATNKYDIATVKYWQDVIPTNSADILATLNQNMQQLKDNLNLIAKGTAGLMNDEYVKTLVVNETGQHAWVTYNALLDKANQQNVDLKQLILNSAASYGATAEEVQTLSSIIRGFSVGGIRFVPDIVFPALNQITHNWNGWDGKTPCYTGISLFYQPPPGDIKGTLPVYAPLSTQQALVAQMPSKPQNTSLQISVKELLQKPVWYVSLQNNINIYEWNGEHMNPNPLSVMFRQQYSKCTCVQDIYQDWIYNCEMNKEPDSTYPCDVGEDGCCSGICKGVAGVKKDLFPCN